MSAPPVLSVVGRVRQVQPLQSGQTLLDLAELDFDSAQAVVQSTYIGPNPGDLDTQRDGRSKDEHR